jgi:hypothetical protein
MKGIGQALLIGLLAAGCAGGSDPYPLLTPPGAASFHPARLGVSVAGVVLDVQVRPGDSIELVSAQPVGLADGAVATFYFAPPEPMPGGGLMTGDTLEPLPGAVFTPRPGASYGPDTGFGIVAVVTASRAGRYTLSGVRLTFRINERAAETKEGITELFTICADDPAPASCGENDSSGP